MKSILLTLLLAIVPAISNAQPEIKNVAGVAWANIASVAGVSAANIKTVATATPPAGGCNAPVFRSAAEAYGGGSGNSITITKPSGTADGDLLVASIYWNDRNQVLTAPTGWVQIDFYNTGDPSASVGCWYKVAGASEPTDYTWSSAGSVTRRGGTIAAFSGSYASNPEDAAVVQTQNSPVSPGITTTNDCAMVIYFSGVDAPPSATWTEPAGWTSAGPDDGSGDTYIGYLYKETAGATGTISYNTGEWNFVWSFIRND